MIRNGENGHQVAQNDVEQPPDDNHAGRADIQGAQQRNAELQAAQQGPARQPGAQQDAAGQPGAQQGPDAVGRRENHEGALQHAIVALVAFIFGLMLLALQIIGFVFAVRGRHTEDIRVNWCSPAFRDFAVAVTTGNCEKYVVVASSSNGIGCISIPGSQQSNWLLGTIISLTLAWFCQLGDVILMMCTASNTTWRGANVHRPWFTIFAGLITLVALIAFSVFNANNLPPDVTETIWIYRKEASRAVGRVCQGRLSPPGLRGVMIGYMDGLFGSWGGVYNG